MTAAHIDNEMACQSKCVKSKTSEWIADSVTQSVSHSASQAEKKKQMSASIAQQVDFTFVST